MDSIHAVSPDVSCEVSLDVSSAPARKNPSGSGRAGPARHAAASSPGKYLVRSGSVYLFQIRMPEDVGGKPARIVRIGLGALTARQAKLQAEVLAALARNRFEQIRMARMQEIGETLAEEAAFGGDLPQITAAEVKGYLKAMHAILSQPAPPTPPHQKPAFDGMKDLVLLNRELAKGGNASPLVARNAEALKREAVTSINKSLRMLDGIDSQPAVPHTEVDASETRAGDSHATAEQAPGAVVSPEAAPWAAPKRQLPSGQDDGGREWEMHGGGGRNEQPEAARSIETDLGSGFFVMPASSEPAGKDSEIRIYRDENGKLIPAHRLDRRKVARKSSNLPRLSEVADEYFDARAIKVGVDNKDLKTARTRLNIFIELIGDHPVDTYSGADLQAYIALMTHWPAQKRHRPDHLSPWEILASNADLRFKPLKRSAFEDGYVSIAKTVIGSKTKDYQYENPLAGTTLQYPATAAPATSAEPLSREQLNKVFRAGTAGGLLDEAMLPLLGNLTGRRLGLLTHLKGNDIREKYPGVWVAQTSGIVLTEEGIWKRVPIKTDQSTTFFVLHDLLREIGFIEWAQARGDAFLFPTLTSLKDPSKQASTYMQRLFRRAGIPGNRREVFHSLRGGQIDLMRDNKVDPRDRRLQAGHKIGEEHDLYGFKAISEKRAREIAHAPLEEEVDYSVFLGLDFEKLSKARRTRGRRPKR